MRETDRFHRAGNPARHQPRRARPALGSHRRGGGLALGRRHRFITAASKSGGSRAANSTRDGLKVTYNAFIGEEYSQSGDGKHPLLEHQRHRHQRRRGWLQAAHAVVPGDGLRWRFLRRDRGDDATGKAAAGRHGLHLVSTTRMRPAHATFNPTLEIPPALRPNGPRPCRKKRRSNSAASPSGGWPIFPSIWCPAAGDTRIPVLIEIDPALMRPETAREMTTPDSEFLQAKRWARACARRSRPAA